jgi:hypothetical protein
MEEGWGMGDGGWERGREKGMRRVFSVLRSRFSALLTTGGGGEEGGDALQTSKFLKNSEV